MEIQGYKIFIDSGSYPDVTDLSNELTNYDNTATTYEIIDSDGIELGKIYRIATVAFNSDTRDSQLSQHLVAGLGSPPTLTAGPNRDLLYDFFNPQTEMVSMMIEWRSIPVTSELTVLGFSLFRDDGLDNDDAFEMIYDSMLND